MPCPCKECEKSCKETLYGKLKICLYCSRGNHIKLNSRCKHCNGSGTGYYYINTGFENILVPGGPCGYCDSTGINNNRCCIQHV